MIALRLNDLYNFSKVTACVDSLHGRTATALSSCDKHLEKSWKRFRSFQHSWREAQMQRRHQSRLRTTHLVSQLRPWVGWKNLKHAKEFSEQLPRTNILKVGLILQTKEAECQSKRGLDRYTRISPDLSSTKAWHSPHLKTQGVSKCTCMAHA